MYCFNVPSSMCANRQAFYECIFQNLLEINIPEIDWEESGEILKPHVGVNVPLVDCPLTAEQMEALRQHIDLLQPSDCNGVDLYRDTVEYVENVRP